MTAATQARNREVSSNPVPDLGTEPIGANTLLLRGTIAALSGGYVVAPTDGDGAQAFGWMRSTIDNRTGSELGGAAGAVPADVDFGGGSAFYTGAVPRPGQALYLVDNQTVSVDPVSSTGNARGFAGVALEVRTAGTVYLYISPLVTAPAKSFGYVCATLPEVPAWVDNTTNGFDETTTNSYVFNPTIDTQFLTMVLPVPENADETQDIVVQIQASISSVAVDNAVKLLLDARINGGANIAPASTVSLTVARQTISFVLPAASIPAGSRSLMLKIRCDNSLDNSDGYVHSIAYRYTKA